MFIYNFLNKITQSVKLSLTFILITVYSIFMFYISSISVVKTNSRSHYIFSLSLILPEVFLFLLIVFLFLLILKKELPFMFVIF